MTKRIISMGVVLLLLVTIASIGASGSPTSGIEPGETITNDVSLDAAQSSTTSSTQIVDSAATTSQINISVIDSKNGQDNATVAVSIGGNVPSDFPRTPDQFTAIAGDDGSIGTFDLVDAIDGAAGNGQYNGVEIGTFDFVDIIEWNSGN